MRGPWTQTKKNQKTFSTNILVLNKLKELRDELKADSINHTLYLLLQQEERVRQLKNGLQEKELELESYRRVIANITEAKNQFVADKIALKTKQIREGLERELKRLTLDIIRQRIYDFGNIHSSYYNYRRNHFTSNHEAVLDVFMRKTYEITISSFQQALMNLLDETNSTWKV